MAADRVLLDRGGEDSFAEVEVARSYTLTTRASRPRNTSLGRPDFGVGWEAAALIGLSLLIASFGLVSLYSASSITALGDDLPDTWYVVRQSVGLLVGFVFLLTFSRIPIATWRLAATPLLVAASAALLVVIIPGTESLAPERLGARRHLLIGPVAAQPGYLATLCLVLWLSHFLSSPGRSLRHLSSLTPALIVTSLLALLLLLQPDRSYAVQLSLVAFGTLLAGGARIGHFIFLGLLALPLLGETLLEALVSWPLAFLGESDPGGTSFQVRQARIALASGGLVGMGLGEGTFKFGFLPQAHSDFVFATIGQEWGFVGSLTLLSFYLCLALVSMRVAGRCHNRFGSTLASGMTISIFLPMVLHVAINLGLLPVAGVALPLVSYGRTSVVATLMAVGILTRIAAENLSPENRQLAARSRRLRVSVTV